MRDAATSTQQKSRTVRPAAWVTLGFILLQAAWILTIPPFRGSDEFDHAYRAAGVAAGQWVATEPAQDGRGLLVEAPTALVVAAGAQCAVLNYTGPDNCGPVRRVSSDRVLVASGAATYFPAYYAVVGTFGKLAEGAGSLYLMRTLSALICAAFVFAAAWAASRSVGRWPLVGLVLAASPVLVYSTSIVAPNGVEMAAALALWSSLLVLGMPGGQRADERKLLGIAILSAVVMCSLRLLGPLFVVVIVLAVIAYRWDSFWLVLRRHLILGFTGALMVMAAVGGFASWVRGPADVFVPDGGINQGSINPIYLFVWPLQAIAAFPYRDQAGPPIVYGVVGAFVLVFLYVGLRVSSRWQRIVIIGACLGALILPFAATIATSEGRGVIWQGRYGLPVGVGFIILSAFAIGESDKARALPKWPAMLMLGIYGGALAACYLKVRGEELSDNYASFTDTTWLVPPTLVLVGLATAAVTCFAAAVIATEAERV